NKRQKTVKDNDDKKQRQHSFENFIDRPVAMPEDAEADEQSDSRHEQLGQYSNGQGGARTAHLEFRLNQLLEIVDVVLKFSGKKFADFRIYALDIRGEHEKREQNQQRDCNRQVHVFERAATARRRVFTAARSMRAAGKRS